MIRLVAMRVVRRQGVEPFGGVGWLEGWESFERVGRALSLMII
jgi:hypothetical protein